MKRNDYTTWFVIISSLFVVAMMCAMFYVDN